MNRHNSTLVDDVNREERVNLLYLFTACNADCKTCGTDGLCLTCVDAAKAALDDGTCVSE